mgnify:CR=1 FL=1
MAKDGAMPQPGLESLDPRVAEANQAKDLAERIEGAFLKDGFGIAVLVSPHLSVRTVAQAIEHFDVKHACDRVSAFLTRDPYYTSLVVRFLPKWK